MANLVLTEMVFRIIWEMFHGSISLNLLSLLLLVNYVSGFRLELMYMSHIISIRSNLTHLHGFQQLMLLPWFIEITFFVCKNRINLLNLKFRHASNHWKGVLEAVKLSYATKTKEAITPRNLAFRNFGKLLIVFSTKINLLYLLYSETQRCCLLHLIKQNYSLKTFLISLILMTWVSL